jgi:hypothetical protein
MFKKLPSGQKSGNYAVGELKNLGNHKYSSSFTILSADEEESKHTHALVVKEIGPKKAGKT